MLDLNSTIFNQNRKQGGFKLKPNLAEEGQFQ